MILNDAEVAAFNAAAQPLMLFLRTLHPHTKVIVDSEGAELVEGLATTRNEVPFPSGPVRLDENEVTIGDKQESFG